MTLRHLRIFVAVCTWGSITRAAEKLHMAQPSVSLAIRELEEYYQLQLFDRISRKLYLTGDGERFLKYASHITSLFDEMENSMEHWSDMESMSIGSSITIANSLLCECLHSYKLEYPKRQIQILIENSMILEESIVSNQLDLALIEEFPHMSIFRNYRFSRMSLPSSVPESIRWQKNRSCVCRILHRNRFCCGRRAAVQEKFWIPS